MYVVPTMCRQHDSDRTDNASIIYACGYDNVNFFQRLSFFLLAELVTVILTGMLDFAVAIVISAGLDHTCDAFNDSHKNGEKLKYILYM